MTPKYIITDVASKIRGAVPDRESASHRIEQAVDLTPNPFQAALVLVAVAALAGPAAAQSNPLYEMASGIGAEVIPTVFYILVLVAIGGWGIDYLGIGGQGMQNTSHKWAKRGIVGSAGMLLVAATMQTFLGEYAPIDVGNVIDITQLFGGA